MPRPGFIICSQLGGLDQYTNAISCTNILEAIQFVRVAPGQAVTFPPSAFAGGLPRPLFVRVASSWQREEGDTPEQQFQAQLIARFPGQSQETVIADFGQFSFVGHLHRLIVPELLLPPLNAPGTLFIECRIRRVGEETWLATQSFPIVVEELHLSQVQGQAAPEQQLPTEAT